MIWLRIVIASIVIGIIVFLAHFGPFYFTRKEVEWRIAQREEEKARGEKTDKYMTYTKEIRESFGPQMRQEFGLAPCGGSFSDKDKIEAINMLFTAYRRATVEEARALQLIVMQRFVEAINAHEAIRPYLAIYPFTVERVKIEINFGAPYPQLKRLSSIDYIYNVDGTVSAVENRNRLIAYVYDPYQEKSLKVLDEPYEEAIRAFEASTDLRPFIHKTTPVEAAIDPLVEQFVTKIREEYRLQCPGIGAKLSDKLEEIRATFVFVQRTEHDQAKKLLKSVVNRLTEMINQSQALKPHLIESPFDTGRLKIRINFVKPNSFSYHDKSVERITLDENVISYYNFANEEDFDSSVYATEEFVPLPFYV